MFGLERLWTSKAPPINPVGTLCNVVPDWQPPEVRHVPADTHVKALMRMAIDSGVIGYVRSRDITRLYAELCWMEGFVPLADRQILCELGTLLERRRLPTNGHSLTHYFVPDPKAPNVVPMRKRRKAKKRSQGRRLAA